MFEILFFIPDLNGGGAERALLNLLAHWPPVLRSQWRPTLVVRNYSGPLVDEVPDWVEVISLDLPRSGIWSSLASVAKLSVILRQRRPRLIVTYLSLPSLILATKFGSPNSILVANIQAPVRQGRYRSGWGAWLYKWSCKWANYYWVTAPGIAEEIQTVLDVSEAQVAVLPNSVDLNQVRAGKAIPVAHPAFLDPEVPVIVTAGRLAFEKRMDILLQAAQQLSTRMAFNLVILGEGPLRTDLEQLALKLGIQKRTYFLGFHPNPWKFMGKAAVFALASDFEGFGNVLIEAMACGVPVVATQVPFGPEYVISNPEFGILIPPRDPKKLADALLRLLTDDSLRARYSQAGLRRAAEFSIEQVTAAFARLVQSL